MPDLFIGNKINDDYFELVEQEYHHCVRVTRHQENSDIYVTDFEGMIFKANIQKIEKDKVLVKITDLYKSETPGMATVSIAISPTSPSERLEWFTEKAVENGIHKIFPMVCERSEVKKVNKERLERIVKAAAKQTLRPLLPDIENLMSFEQVMNATSDIDQKFIAHCNDGLEGFLGKLYNPQKKAIVLIGPAGDFSNKEIQSALTKNYHPVSLGPYRLRTETAGLTALQIIQTMKQL
ncbi:MAG: 16S rRNA (uracil(1498)-N(3))-methyltransferase [Saprospiraceae bacterium]|nr:16S rRNA (uracil(1498)-N(3))-methyltransferase [Saprospiraceae bacterium]